MWKIAQQLLPALLVILFVTQIIIPILFNGKTWWLFRPEKKKTEEKTSDPSTLSDELKQTKTIVDETNAKVNTLKEKVEGNLKSAEDLKNEVDKLK